VCRKWQLNPKGLKEAVQKQWLKSQHKKGEQLAPLFAFLYLLSKTGSE
jgi:hypothetical protein